MFCCLTTNVDGFSVQVADRSTHLDSWNISNSVNGFFNLGHFVTVEQFFAVKCGAVFSDVQQLLKSQSISYISSIGFFKLLKPLKFSFVER